MKIAELRTTFDNAVKAFFDILPRANKSKDWSQFLPLDVIVTAQSDADFEDFTDNWEKFLDSLDKVWNRLQAFNKHHINDLKKQQSLEGFLGQINKERTTDELLVYLDKARNSAHHTLWRHIRQSNQNEIVTDAEGVNITFENNQLNFYSPNGGTVSEIVVLAQNAILLKPVQVIEKKVPKIYNPPTIHLNTPLYPTDRVLPQIVGKKGLQYYLDVIEKYEARFAK